MNFKPLTQNSNVDSVASNHFQPQVLQAIPNFVLQKWLIRLQKSQVSTSNVIPVIFCFNLTNNWPITKMKVSNPWDQFWFVTSAFSNLVLKLV